MPTIAYTSPSPTRWMTPRQEAASPAIDPAWMARQQAEAAIAAERARMAAVLACEADDDRCDGTR